jgi:AAA ATPase domain
MYRVQFTDFRCFGASNPVEIRPITLLVGENSAGKTSFLAGLRFLLESFSRGARNPFNRDPYFLGGFDQIARYKGGRGARAKDFSMSVQIALSVNGRSRYSPQDGAVHRFTFLRGAPQPDLHRYQFSANETDLDLSLDDAGVELTINRDRRGNAPISFREGRMPTAAMLREDLSYITYLVQELGYRLESGPQRGLPDEKDLELRAELTPKIFQPFRRAFHDSSETLSQNVFASAPVRTQPLRVYTPSDLVPSSEGSHVPLELSRAKAGDPARWAAIREGLISFGQNSGLFTDIDIRQLGKSDIDPFQVMVRTNGPSMNLADVGYGISQVLPIVFQVQHASRHGTFLLQQPEVHLHPRAQAELGSLLVTMAAVKGSRPTFVVETHSDYLVDRVRIDVAAGKISPNDVTIVFFQKGLHGSTADNLFLNDQGEIKDAPDEFRAFFIEEHGRLLGL